MRAKLTATLVALALCLMTSAAFAEVKSFPKFSINVPDGWETSQEGPTVILVAKDKSASISITIAPTGGASAKDLAAAFAKELGGSEPKYDQENDTYEFTFNKGVESNAVFTVEGEEYLLVVIAGENPQIQDILGSMEEK